MTTRLVDLAEFALPILESRTFDEHAAPPRLAEFQRSVTEADGLLIVAPEYKNGYPGVLKNALDYLEAGAFRGNPVAICTVSSGGFGGLNCLAQLRLVCLALGGLPIPAKLPISHVQEVFQDDGQLLDSTLERKLETFLHEFLWYSRAVARQRHMDGESKQPP